MLKLTAFLLIFSSALHEILGAKWQNEENCGLAFTNRIIGGKLATNGKYPWLVRLGYPTAIPGRYSYLCGGTLITKTFVVTAAHCVNYKKNVAVVHIGETEITCTISPCNDQRVQEIPVKNIISNTEFNTNNGYADIALLELSSPVIYTDWVKTICLPSQPVVKFGDKCIVAGWGMENYITRERPGGLKELTMEIIPGDNCKKHFPQSDFNSENYICGGGKDGEDTCGGDSGGPLMKILNLGDSPRMYLLGIISFGSTKCGVGVPGIFTSVSYQLDWIIEHVY